MDDIIKILIIGGYGNTGRALARLLLEYTPENVHLVLAGRHPARADALTTALNRDFPGTRVSSTRVDAADATSLQGTLTEHGLRLVILASSTAKFVEIVASAAMTAKVDYLDLQYSAEKTAYLQSQRKEIEHAGLCFITDAGFHPGLPAALIRWMAPFFASMQTAHVGSAIQIDWKGTEEYMSVETMEEFAEEFVGMKMMDYKDSAWKAAGWADLLRPREMDFGEPFGRKPCIPMFLEELRSLPDLYPSLQETGFYVGGLNWAVDWLMTPIVMIALTLWPTTPRVSRAMGKFLYWGLTTFSQPPFGTRLKVEATGLDKEGAPRTQELELSHVDGYAMTAIPVAATVLQYLSSSKEHPIRKPGLWLQGLAVDPQMLLVDMERMGIDIQPPLGQVETKGLPG